MIAAVILMLISTTLNTRDRKRRDSLPKDNGDSMDSTDKG